MRFLLLAALLCASAFGQRQVWYVRCTEAEVVPPTGSAASNHVLLWYDGSTMELDYLMIPVGVDSFVTAIHFHGPAPPGQQAQVRLHVPVTGPVLEGTFILGQPGEDDLYAGLFYINVHTGAIPQGEVRGQVDDRCRVEVLCDGQANSAHPSGARLVTSGSAISQANDFQLVAGNVPAGQFGYVLVGEGTQTVTPPGSQGGLCLGGAPMGGYSGQVLRSTPAGILGPFTPDLSSLPAPLSGAVQAGDTWGFQAWYRDIGGTSGFTDAIRVTFE